MKTIKLTKKVSITIKPCIDKKEKEYSVFTPFIGYVYDDSFTSYIKNTIVLSLVFAVFLIEWENERKD